MLTDEELVEKAKKMYEESTGWGDSTTWANRDFIALSEKIQERTGVSLSHVTLKRVWGKVKYESLPTAHTLNTLVQFLGYENWRDFKSKESNGAAAAETVAPIEEKPEPPAEVKPVALIRQPKRIISHFSKPAIAAAIIVAAVCVIAFLPSKNAVINKADYTFSSKKVVAAGLPNSVIFDYDASKSPFDSVTIQQSWDVRLQTKVPKTEHQHTCIYYYPDYYHAKLIVGKQVVQEHDLLIKSNGWMGFIEKSPVPVYFKNEDFMVHGSMALPADKILGHNIAMQPNPPMTDYTYVDDFGELYSDNFTFETALKNDYNEGASVCQLSQVFILCKESAIWIPLCVKGCVSDVDLSFTNFYASGKKEDLSAFGVDFSHFVKLRIESKNAKATIFVNDKPAYTITHNIGKTKIIGVLYRFSGTGSVDYVRMGNGKVAYDEEF